MFPCTSIPRPEYPRPDKQRGRVEGVDWLNLNGPWQFRFDPQRRGEQERWFSGEGPDWREQIIVPFCWESLAAWGAADAAGNDNYYSTRVFIDPLEVTRENHREAPRHEVGWYRRTISIPQTAAWKKRRVILTIGAADFFTDCWCNGVFLGRHEGGYLPFEYDLTDALSQANGSNSTAQIVIRVEDPMDNRQQPVGKQWGWYTTTSGIWQTVYLEPRSESYIESFRIIPDIDNGRVRFDVELKNAPENATIAADIIPPEAPPHRFLLTRTDGSAAGDSEIYPVSLWDTSDPRLYRVVFRLLDEDRELDAVRSYFGMRKISTLSASSGKEPAMLCLNNKPIYLRGALYQSFHPAGVYTAPDAKTLHDDIAYAREVGFDFLRIHIKLDDPLVLYYADQLGILIMQDLPNFGEGGDTPLGRTRFEAMLREGIRRDFNHPSIISWCIFNETWGFGGQTELMKLIGPGAAAQRAKGRVAPDAPVEAPVKISNQTSFQWVHAMWQLAKSLDPTRLIEDMSVVVWEHLQSYGHVDTDINSWHFYLDDYAKAKQHIESVVAKTYRGSNFNYIEGYQQGDAPLINSEYGGVGALDGDRDVSWSFKFLTNELRRHGQLSAYIYTELHDVEWEYNGFLNYDRTPKEFGYAPSVINQGDVLPINAAPIVQYAPGSAIAVEVLSSHFSRRRRENVTLHWLYSGIDTLGTLHPELARGKAPIAFQHHRVELARKIEIEAPDQPMLCTLAVAAVTPEGQTVASNFIQHFVSTGSLPEREERGKTLVLRRPVHAWSNAVWTSLASMREEAQRAGACHAQGTGFFEWLFDDAALANLSQARRVRLLCEVSARRTDTPQTDSHRFPTNFELLLNGFPVYRGILPDHPHDSRGALSYLRGGRGAYGYLIRTTIEDDLLAKIAESAAKEGGLRFRCSVPHQAPDGGLTVYDFDCGRFPVGPTIIVEWEQG
ncbi:MAG TPA: glycoside hydrolase family 2 TIM barrel-domain containing protein [Opitutaceae bacterium]|nr:glycoside hydrolase family 2 TIM barrel-domain containing protein [Opitutaceae bacterium]